MEQGHPAGNLPTELSSFVGRRSAVSEIKNLLSRARLLTMTGGGGVGKSRIALRVAAEVRRSYPDGVWLVELSTLANPSLLTQAIADSLRVCGQSSRTPAAVLLDHVRNAQLLLVLDNCEHILSECAVVAATLLEAAPGLRILATSRHALLVDEEHVFLVPPLAISDRDRAKPMGAPDCDEAVLLFRDRAAAVLPGFRVNATNHDTVRRICLRLDGLPLAIELAAARLRMLTPLEILQRLDNRFDLLTGGHRTASPRQQTLLAAVSWSYELCSPLEQRLWVRTSVFAGYFEAGAAEAVCAADDLPRTAIRDLLAGLVDKSILSREGVETPDRYRMLDTVRHYGRLRLESTGEDRALRRRHRDHYRRLVRTAEARWFGAEQLVWTDLLRREHPNLRVALDFCLTEPGERHIGLAMATALWIYWIPCGLLSEGRHWLSTALAEEETPARARGLWIIGWITQLQGDLTRATALLNESRALAERLGYRSAQAFALHYSACVAMFQGDHRTALTRYTEASARHRELGHEVGVSTSLFRLALCYCLRGEAEQGDIEHAIALAQECARRCEATGESWCLSRALYTHGLALWKQDKNQEAGALARRSLRLQAQVGDFATSGVNLELLAWIAAAAGDHERTARLLGAAAHIWRAVGAPLFGIVQLVTHHERIKRETMAALGTTVFQEIFGEGTQLDFDQAVRYALNHEKPSVLTGAVSHGEETLTPREHQVVALIAQGLSNKEIATRLVIALRTAEGHVARIMTKLGCTNRIQITVWMKRCESLPART